MIFLGISSAKYLDESGNYCKTKYLHCSTLMPLALCVNDHIGHPNVQSSAVIARSNITWYCIHHCSDWDKVQITIWYHKKYIPYLALTGELWGVFCKNLGENWSGYNDTAVYTAMAYHSDGRAYSLPDDSGDIVFRNGNLNIVVVNEHIIWFLPLICYGGVFCKNLGENWSGYNDTAVYTAMAYHSDGRAYSLPDDSGDIVFRNGNLNIVVVNEHIIWFLPLIFMLNITPRYPRQKTQNLYLVFTDIGVDLERYVFDKSERYTIR